MEKQYHLYVLKSLSFDENIVQWSNRKFQPPVFKIGKCECPVHERIKEINGIVSARGVRDDPPYGNQNDWQLVISKQFAAYQNINEKQRTANIIQKERDLHRKFEYANIKNDYPMIKRFNGDSKDRKELFASRIDAAFPSYKEDVFAIGLLQFDSITEIMDSNASSNIIDLLLEIAECLPADEY